VFDAGELPQFGVFVERDYQRLSEKAVKVLLPFVTT
jgi:hypothetical protein